MKRFFRSIEFFFYILREQRKGSLAFNFSVPVKKKRKTTGRSSQEGTEFAEGREGTFPLHDCVYFSLLATNDNAVVVTVWGVAFGRIFALTGTDIISRPTNWVRKQS